MGLFSGEDDPKMRFRSLHNQVDLWEEGKKNRKWLNVKGKSIVNAKP